MGRAGKASFLVLRNSLCIETRWSYRDKYIYNILCTNFEFSDMYRTASAGFTVYVCYYCMYAVYAICMLLKAATIYVLVQHYIQAAIL